MTETEKQIKRAKRIEKAKSDYWTEVRKLETIRNRKIKKDLTDEKNLLEQCGLALDTKIEEEHSCECCDIRYPDKMDFTEDGKLWVRYDADHPNDIHDYEYDIDELLKKD